MTDLLIAQTDSTPQIDFKISGQMTMKGSSLPENPQNFFDPLYNWVKELSVETVQIDLKLEYVNTSSSKRVIELIKAIDNNNKVKKVNLSWYYEEDDLDMLEYGEMIEKSLKRTKTKFIECDDLDG